MPIWQVIELPEADNEVADLAGTFERMRLGERSWLATTELGTVRRMQELNWVELNWFFNVTINDISVIYVTAHRDVQADWRRSWTYGRAPNAIDIS